MEIATHLNCLKFSFIYLFFYLTLDYEIIYSEMLTNLLAEDSHPKDRLPSCQSTI